MNEYLTEFYELVDKAGSKLNSQEFDEFCERVVETMRDDYDVEIGNICNER